MHSNICNAFWLYDPLSDQPRRKFRPGDTTEEIDIFELFGKEGTIPGENCDRTLFFTVHCLDTRVILWLLHKTAGGSIRMRRWRLRSRG